MPRDRGIRKRAEPKTKVTEFPCDFEILEFFFSNRGKVGLREVECQILEMFSNLSPFRALPSYQEYLDKRWDKVSTKLPE